MDKIFELGFGGLLIVAGFKLGMVSLGTMCAVAYSLAFPGEGAQDLSTGFVVGIGIAGALGFWFSTTLYKWGFALASD